MTRIADWVRSAELRNGARIYLLESHANLTVDVVGYIEGGLFAEDPRKSGAANLCVGMLDRGTQHRDQTAIAEALESNGALLAHGLSREMVTLKARCLSEDLELVIEILGETLRAPVFPEDQLRLVREDAKAGLREAAFDTYARAYRRCSELLLGPDHPYARESLGREELLDGLGRSDLEAYHREAVAGSRLSLSVAGDIHPERTLELLDAHLGALIPGEPAGELPAAGKPPPAHEPPPRAKLPPDEVASQGGLRREHIPIPDKGQIDIVFMGPGVERTSPEFEAHGLANFILGGSFLSRLNQQLRDTEGLTYGAQSTIVSGLNPGVWSAYIGIHPTDVERAMDGVLREMRRFAEEGASEDELQMARQHLTGSFPIKLETNRAVAAVLLEGIRSGRGLDFIDRYAERVGAVTRDQVNRAARRLFDTDHLVITSAGAVPAGS